MENSKITKGVIGVKGFTGRAQWISLLVMISFILLLVMGCGSSKQEEKKLDFPKKPINIIVPFAVGGATDTVARAIGEASAKNLGQSVVVLNRAGGSGTVGAEEGSTAKPDGYTISLTSAAILTVQPQLKSVKYKIDDFNIICSVTYNPLILVVDGNSPYNTVKDFIEGAKKNNKTIKVGHPGVGTANDIATSAFFKDLGIAFVNIPFKSNNETIAAMMGGHVDIGAVHPMESMEFVKSKKLKALGVFTPQPVENLSGIPTIAQARKDAGTDFKYKDHDFSAWYYLAVPKSTSPEIVKYLSEKLMISLNAPGFIENAKKLHMNVKIMQGDSVAKQLKGIGEINKEILIDTGILKK